MSNDNQMPLGSYIFYSMKAAWKLVQSNPKFIDYFDCSSDGFWKSFWAIAAMIPAYLLWTYYNLQGDGAETINGVQIAYPFLSHGVFFFTILPLTAFVMVYFTKWMNISENYASMVIVYNWLTAIKFSILTCFRIILSSGIVSTELSLAMLLLLQLYFNIYVVWFALKNSLKISGMLAVGVLLFVSLLDETVLAVCLKVFNPDFIDSAIESVNNQLSENQ